ncbi:hypothetical protein [Mesonia aestuariivivens]|uniref:Uncharacterized protein n=1 Tax=Mesonia aestuariivivens TaxID=2796128 RepID=A0ABS6W0I1_9FLAO|nr:hypothetical protein [Mesonia aestuariivivens]MBW2961264.1 hypothetical protein [Mesonia aestuariivivens]
MNGKTYVRNFHAYVSGDKVRIVNAYDTKDELLAYTSYTQFSYNGNTYNSAIELMAAIALPLFRKLGDSSDGNGGVINNSNNIKITRRSVWINWNSPGHRDLKVATRISSSAPFIVSGNELVIYQMYKNATMYQVENYNPEIHLWIFKPGKGTYGYGATPVAVNDLLYIGYTRKNFQNIEYNLGEIGNVPISLYINEGTDKYTTNQDVYNIFKCKRLGETFTYVFIGTDKYLIGNIENGLQTDEVFEEEFNLLTGETIFPPQPTDNVTYQDYNSSLYDRHDFILTDVIANASNQFSGANFYLIEADQESTPYHFAVKNSLAGRFTDFAIQIINASGQRQDLKAFDFEYNGYKIWKLPNITNYSDLQNNPFQVWFYNDSSIRYDIEQDLTHSQQQQAQENIGLISDEIPDWTSEAENEINF